MCSTQSEKSSSDMDIDAQFNYDTRQQAESNRRYREKQADVSKTLLSNPKKKKNKRRKLNKEKFEQERLLVNEIGILEENFKTNLSNEADSTEEEHQSDESVYFDGEYSEEESFVGPLETNFNSYLYENAQLTLNEFNILFMGVTSRLTLPETHSSILFDFIRLILPKNHLLPETYYRLKKSFIKYDLIVEKKLCHLCKSELVNNLCSNKEDCLSTLLNPSVAVKKSIKVITANVRSQLSIILHNHYDKMVRYKHLCSKEEKLTDICNGSNYLNEANKISLVIFIDGVTYTKSVANQMWAVFSSIAELPPILRGAYENIMFHSIWSGPNLDFNFFLEKFNSEIDDLLKEGIEYNGIKIKVIVHVFIADSPGRTKVLNTLQFNGKFGCLMCLHPTFYEKQTIYPMMPNIQPRTHSDYIYQVNKALALNEPFEGVKGFAYISNWLTVPESIGLDYMHMCLLGTFKYTITMLLLQKNHNFDYYIGRKIGEIDNVLLKVKLPIEAARTTRSLNDRCHFKANEWRNLAFYLIIPVLKGVLATKYFNNLVKYIVFLRILCQKSISKDDLSDANTIITEFCTEYETLYGKQCMTFNLHSHLHLVNQVERFGPLPKCSCFAFENMFRITRDLFHGTRNFEAQIAHNLVKKQTIKVELEKIRKDSKSLFIKEFIKTHLNHYESQIDRLLEPNKKAFYELKFYERDLLKMNENSFVYQSTRACFNSIVYHTKAYADKSNTFNCYTIEFKDSLNNSFFGNIVNFLNVSNQICIVINVFNIINYNFKFKKLSGVVNKHLYNFFILIEISDVFILAKPDDIIRRCVIIQNKNDLILSPCVDLNEHD